MENLSLKCNRPLCMFRVGDTAEIQLAGVDGIECSVEISENDVPLKTETLCCPSVMRITLEHSGVVRCTASTTNGQKKSLALYVNPEERICAGRQQRLSENYQRYGNVVNEYYVARFRELAAERQRRLQAITTREEAERYIHDVRAKIRALFNLDAEPRTPLNAHITKAKEFPLYRLENVAFESAPGYYVTGNLYLPKEIHGKIPGTLIICGHSINGKSYSSYALIAATLAANGVGALIVDPVSQGERFQYSASPSTENVGGHNELGKKLLLAGEWFGEWRAFDAVRSLDYLLSRPEIDASRVYATGSSGGGTLTTWLTAIDDRLAGAIPSCYVSSWKIHVENELPIDVEQTPPILAGMGLDIADFLIAAAPRPLLVLEAINDFFDVRGSHQAMEDVQRIYRLLGVEANADYFEGEGNHGYNFDQRERCFKKIMEWSGLQYLLPQDKVTLPTTEELLVAPNGNVHNFANAISAEERAKKRRDAVIAKRTPLAKDALCDAIRQNLHISEENAAPSYRNLRHEYIDETETIMNRYLLEDGTMIFGLLRYFTPLPEPSFMLPPAKSALLYIPHWNSPVEFPQIFSSADNQYDAYYSFDPFGVGALTPSSCDHHSFHYGTIYGFDYHFSAMGLMLGEPYLGLRVKAILKAIALLHAKGVQEITICGAGRSTIATTFAALLAGSEIQKTILVNPLDAYENIPLQRTQWGQAELQYGILEITDLPEIYRLINPNIITKDFAKVKQTLP
ncbi:MAG: acetylxylan esterase [Lentisphaeria bacterium]|nr:acetylxylan esterase [Lentisphaeria bacterium]